MSAGFFMENLMAQTLTPSIAVVTALENELKTDPAQFRSDYAKRDLEKLAELCEQVSRRVRGIMSTGH
jgi:hypothetical protein